MDPYNPYAKEHSATEGPGDARPTAVQVVHDSGRVGQWTGKVALVTGGTSGIGLETAVALHATGARIIITARDQAKAQTALEHIRTHSIGKGPLDFIIMDLDSLQSVRQGAQDFLAKGHGLNILVNNAGIMAVPYTKTIDGFERQFAVNHLAHFTLSVLLLPTLISSSSNDFKSRIVLVSSSSHRYSSVHFEDINYENRPYDPFAAYGQSKTAMIWTANYIDRTYSPRAVNALSIHPGGIWSGLQQHVNETQVAQWKEDPDVTRQMKSPAQGAATTIWAAVAPIWEGQGGVYLADCKRTEASKAEDPNSTMDDGYGPHAFGEVAEKRLWELSLKWSGAAEP